MTKEDNLYKNIRNIPGLSGVDFEKLALDTAFVELMSSNREYGHRDR